MTNTVPVVVDNGTWGFSIGITPIGFVVIAGVLLAGTIVLWTLWKGRKRT